MNWQAIVFLVLVGNQVVATGVFVAIYVSGSNWRRSAIGRHLLYWPIASGLLDLSWVLLLLVQWPWLVFVLLAMQALVGGLTWWRVVLALRAQRARSDQPS